MPKSKIFLKKAAKFAAASKASPQTLVELLLNVTTLSNEFLALKLVLLLSKKNKSNCSAYSALVRPFFALKGN